MLGSLLNVAGAIGSALISGKVAKILGQKNETAGRMPFHQIASPAAAVATPIALVATGVLDLQAICSLMDRICSNPESAGALLGLAAVLLHTLGKNAKQFFSRSS